MSLRSHTAILGLVASLAGLALVSSCVTPSPSAEGEASTATGTVVEVEAEVEVEAVESASVPPITSPPFEGTVYISSEVLSPTSPSAFLDVTSAGVASRTTFDRRVNDWVTNPSRIFTATFSCGRESVDVIVNLEFTEQEAQYQAERFAFVLGQMPVGLRQAVEEIWVHDGSESAGGGNRSILVHTQEIDGVRDYLEEIFLHEAAHTTLDPAWGGVVDATEWNLERAQDPTFISTYAEKNPDREDIAESYGAFIAWSVLTTQGLLPGAAALVEGAIPHRLEFFEGLGPDYGPFTLLTCIG